MVGTRETGNETYTLNLIKALLALPPSPGSPLELLLYTTHPGRLRSSLPSRSAAVIRQVRPAPSMLRIPFGIPARTWRDRPDLLHVTYVAPPLSTCRTVVTVHDISFEFFPQYFAPKVRWMLQALVPLSLRRATRAITVSEHARDEIAHRYGLPRERIAVTYLAADETYRPVTDVEQLEAMRTRYGLRKRYLLALGNLQPRKNLIRLGEAYVDLRQHGYLADVQLVLAGQAQWRESEIYRFVRSHGLVEDVCFPGYVDNADLPALYSAALAFVYPSLYEGFGLPPLEAMACGTPVVCSNAASLPEVVGDAALMIDPRNTATLADALRRIASEPGLRAELIQRGQRRAASFSWQACAEKTAAVYQSAWSG